MRKYNTLGLRIDHDGVPASQPHAALPEGFAGINGPTLADYHNLVMAERTQAERFAGAVALVSAAV